jgi:hypothetical protein
MKLFLLLAAALPWLIAGSVPAPAQDKGPWRAASSEAKTITGDLGVYDGKLILNFSTFPLAEIRSLTPDEAAAAFDADRTVPGGGNLYRLNIPADKRFQHHNTLCGSDATQWMATWAAGSGLHVAFFSGAAIPRLTLDALANSPTLCGSYGYVR